MPLIRFQLRRGTAAEWASVNPVLASGEPGVETDTGQQKLGDGVSTWAALPYVTAGWQGVQDALQARTDAQAAAGTAAGQATAAAQQATLAAGQVTLAAGQVALATGAKTGAESAKTGALTAKADAEAALVSATTQAGLATAAKTGAESARTGALTAKADAEAARDAAGAFYGTTVQVGAVDVNGDLILTRTNGVQVNAGHVLGGKGDKGDKGNTGDMFPVTGPGNAPTTFNVTEAMLSTTQLWTLTGNVTVTLGTPVAPVSGTVTIVMTQDATGSRTITWPSASVLKWPEGIAQQPAVAGGSISVFHLLWTGTQWLGLLGGKSFA